MDGELEDLIKKAIEAFKGNFLDIFEYFGCLIMPNLKDLKNESRVLNQQER